MKRDATKVRVRFSSNHWGLGAMASSMNSMIAPCAMGAEHLRDTGQHVRHATERTDPGTKAVYRYSGVSLRQLQGTSAASTSFYASSALSLTAACSWPVIAAA